MPSTREARNDKLRLMVGVGARVGHTCSFPHLPVGPWHHRAFKEMGKMKPYCWETEGSGAKRPGTAVGLPQGWDGTCRLVSG